MTRPMVAPYILGKESSIACGGGAATLFPRRKRMKLASLLKRLFAFGMAAWMITLLGAPAGAVPQ